MAKNQFIDIKVEGIGQLEKMQAFLDPKLFEKARRAGILAASKSANKQAGMSISQRYNIRSGRVKQDIRLSTGRARYGEASLIFAGRPPTINQFGFKPGTRATGQKGLGRGRGWSKPAKRGKPGSAAIVKGSRQQYPTTFLARSKSGTVLPFRIGSNGKMQVVYGPSVARMFDAGQFSPIIRAEIEIEINRSFIAGYQRALDSAARGYGGR